MLYIMLALGCVIKIVEPVSVQPPEQIIIHQPPPERVVIQRTVIINKNKRIVVKHPKRKRRPKATPIRKSRPKLRQTPPKKIEKQKKRSKNDLPKQKKTE